MRDTRVGTVFIRKLVKVGNSMGIIIPRSIADLADIKLGALVRMEVRDGAIVVTRLKKRKSK